MGPQAVSFVERMSLFRSVHYQRFYCIQYVRLFAHTVGPPNIRNFGDDIRNSADLFFIERFSSLGGSKCTVGIIPGP